MLLVPGWSDTARALRHAERYFREHGWAADHVRALSFRDRYGCNTEHAGEIAAAVEALAEQSGHTKVAIVAHSMGGLAVRRYLADSGGARVHTVVFAGTPHKGTWLAWLAWGRGAPQMRPGSRYLQELAHARLPEGVRVLCIRTPLDLRILPGRSAWLEGAPRAEVWALRHQWLLRSRRALDQIRELLLEEGPAPPRLRIQPQGRALY